MINRKDLKEVEEKLKSYPILQKKIESIKKRLEIINDGLIKIRTSKFDNIRGGTNEDKLEKLLDEKTKLINELNYLEIKKKLVEEIINVLNEIEREVVVNFYFKNYSTVEISIKLKYTVGHIRKIRQNAIFKLSSF